MIPLPPIVPALGSSEVENIDNYISILTDEQTAHILFELLKYLKDYRVIVSRDMTSRPETFTERISRCPLIQSMIAATSYGPVITGERWISIALERLSYKAAEYLVRDLKHNRIWPIGAIV